MSETAIVAVLILIIAAVIILSQPPRQEEDEYRSTSRVAPGSDPQTILRVVAVDAGANRIAALRVIRELTGLGVREAKDIIERGPGAEMRVRVRDLNRAVSDLLALGIEACADADDLHRSVQVELVSVPEGDGAVAVIKVLREVTPVGMREAKELVDSTPCIVLRNVAREEAERALAALTRAGAVARVLQRS